MTKGGFSTTLAGRIRTLDIAPLRRGPAEDAAAEEAAQPVGQAAIADRRQPEHERRRRQEQPQARAIRQAELEGSDRRERPGQKRPASAAVNAGACNKAKSVRVP